MRREAEGFWRCAGEDDDEAWLSEVDAIDLRLENTNESQGYASDSMEDSEGVLNLRKGAATMEWSVETWIKNPTCGCADIKIVFQKFTKHAHDTFTYLL